MLMKKREIVNKGLLERVAEYVSNKYNLDSDYTVSKFDAKPNKLIIGMITKDVELNVTITGTTFELLVEGEEPSEEE